MEAAPPGFVVKRGARGKTVVDIERSTSLTSQPSSATVPTAAAVGDEAPFGFEKLPGMTASVVNFQQRCEWFYVDPAGEEHGPVQLQKIVNWHKKGHFPDDVKVRCRSPWFAVGHLAKSLEEAADSETPTSARVSGGGSSSHAGGTDVGPYFATAPPPPPPPRSAASGPGSWSGAADVSSFGSSAAAPGSFDAELKALFAGDVSSGSEPVWYYIDRSDQLQGPFSAQEMIGWVSSDMLTEDTKMCGADASLGIPPGRNLFVPLSELLVSVRCGEPHRPAHLDKLRRKASIAAAAGVLLQPPPPPPPPPPPRRADSVGAGTADGSSAFGPPGRGSDAPTWRKDIPAPASSSTAPSAAGAREGSSSSAAAADNTPPGGSSKAARSDKKATEADSGSAAANSMEDMAAEYHNSNAAALDVVLAPESDFEYGEDFKKQRQTQQAAAQVPTGSSSVTGNKDGVGIGRGRSMQDTEGGGSEHPRQLAACGNAGSSIAHPSALLLQASQQQQLLQTAAQQGINLLPEQLQQMILGAHQHQQVQAGATAQQQAHAAAMELQRLASGSQGLSSSQGFPAALMPTQSGPGAGRPGNMIGMGVPASAPIAIATAAGNAGGKQMLPAGITASLLNLQLQQQQPQSRMHDVPAANGHIPMLMNMSVAAQQAQQRMTQAEQPGQQPQPVQQQPLPGQQAVPVSVPTGLQPTLQQMIQAGHGAQVQALLQQLSAAAPHVPGHQQLASGQQHGQLHPPQQQQQQHGHQQFTAVTTATAQSVSAAQQIQQMQQHMRQLAVLQQQQRQQQQMCLPATQAGAEGTISTAAVLSAPGSAAMPQSAAQHGRP